LIAGCLLAPTEESTTAQPTGQLAGVVRDTTGGLLPGATLTVTGPAPAASRTVVTDDRGSYQLDDLPAGRYMVEASLGGFESRTAVIDIDGGVATLDLVLTVGSVVERVTVTATKTGAADIQATPIAVTALGARTLEQLGAQTVEGLAGFVPTLTISQQSGLAMVTIRGIGTNVVLAGADPSSTIHLDGVYLARPAMVYMDFLNVERVEVLRGPQGTLYGRNSVGGTINVVTRQPTNVLETSVRLTAGNYDKGPREHGGVLYRSSGPASAVVHPAWPARYQQRRIGADQRHRNRSGGRGAGCARCRSFFMAGRHLRPVSRRGGRRFDARRGGPPLEQRAALV
jgi:outer membrane receptor protein involved in Fe transport